MSQSASRAQPSVAWMMAVCTQILTSPGVHTLTSIGEIGAEVGAAGEFAGKHIEKSQQAVPATDEDSAQGRVGMRTELDLRRAS